MANYYVIRNKETGFYFRGKGANRWGKYHNQASIYRMKAHAENTLGWLLRHAEPVEILPIQIVENPNDIVEVVHGRWIESKLEVGGWCSKCDHYYEWWETSDANYCPHCGAKMDK